MIPTLLPRGVTGFDPPPHVVSFADFKRSCTEAAKRFRGGAGQFREAFDQFLPNFHQAVLSFPDGPEPMRVVCNAHHPIVAFATSPQEGEMRLEFLDFPELARLLSGEFTVLSGVDAAAPLSTELLANLGPAERTQIDYWNPERVGDVIFNWWD
jgi:hypothetical protein